MHLFAEIMSLNVNLTIRPHQLVQYQKLKSAMMSQKRYDTMLRQRPNSTEEFQPKAWWKYGMACVMSRPTSRPWGDVKRIVSCRSRYMVLVQKKFHNAKEGSGFHGSLTEKESQELLSMEDLLPIEALSAFHLLALRRVHESQQLPKTSNGKDNHNADSKPHGRVRTTFRKILIGVGGGGGGNSGSSSNSHHGHTNGNGRSSSYFSDRYVDEGSEQLLRKTTDGTENLMRSYIMEAITERFGKKAWHTTFHLNKSKINLALVVDTNPILDVEATTRGMVRTFGKAKREFMFDVIQTSISDPANHVPQMDFRRGSGGGKILHFEQGQGKTSSSSLLSSPSSELADRFEESLQVLYDTMHARMDSKDAVCRLWASKTPDSLTLGMSAHPATLVWNKPTITAMSGFFASPAAELQTEVTKQLRTVATPLARRAQLALLSPVSIKIDVAIAAPKVWFPVTSNIFDGAVLFDSGRLKVALLKPEKRTDRSWSASVRDTQVKFIRPQMVDRYDIGKHKSLTVVKPFHVEAKAVFHGSEQTIGPGIQGKETEDAQNKIPPGQAVEVIVSPVCLSLVDAEVVARAIGKWYAFGLVKVKKLSETQTNNNGIPKSGASPKGGGTPKSGGMSTPKNHQGRITGNTFETPGPAKRNTLTVRMERVELAIPRVPMFPTMRAKLQCSRRGLPSQRQREGPTWSKLLAYTSREPSTQISHGQRFRSWTRRLNKWTIRRLSRSHR